MCVCAPALPFRYNQISDLEKILEENSGEMAAIVVCRPVRAVSDNNALDLFESYEFPNRK